MSSQPVEPSSGQGKSQTGKVFAVGALLFFVMVAASIALIYVAAKNDAVNRERHPVIGRP